MSRAMYVVLVLAIASIGCSKKEEKPLPPIDGEFLDEFERDESGADYRDTHGQAFSLTNGSLRAQGAHNRPLWLKRRIPDNAVIELDAWSQSPSGDIKVEIYGDGHSYDPDQGSYLSTGYVLVFGGWDNSKSIIARLDEHGKDLVERKEPRVERGNRYHWKIIRSGNKVTWFVDDMNTPFLELVDPKPLTGPKHGYFGFNNWESDVGFDNLSIKAL